MLNDNDINSSIMNFQSQLNNQFQNQQSQDQIHGSQIVSCLTNIYHLQNQKELGGLIQAITHQQGEITLEMGKASEDDKTSINKEDLKLVQ